MIYDPLNSLNFFSLIQVVVFLFLHFRSPVLTRDRQDNRNYREIKFSTTSFPACFQAETNGWCQTSNTAQAHAAAHRRMLPACVRACTVCGPPYFLSSALTSCDSWLKVGSSGPVVPDQPGETLEIRWDRGNRTWWHPPCHPLSQPDPCTAFLHSLLSACGPLTRCNPHQMLFSVSFSNT